jgi:hypothetical protein
VGRKGRDEKPIQSEDSSLKRTVQRFNVLADEIDRLTADADERSRAVDVKASFLSVAAGVVLGGQVQAEFGFAWFISSTPLFLAAMSLAAAGVSFVPRKREGNSPRLVWLAYFDSTKDAATVAKELTQERVRTESLREEALAKRARILTAGFATLFTSMLLFVVLFAVDLAIH